MKKLVIRKYLDVPFGITIASPILTTAEAGHTMLENHAGFNVSVVVFKNGKIISMISEERLSRIKNHLGFPHKAYQMSLEMNKIRKEDIVKAVRSSRDER